MRLSDFDYNLPKELIAQHPCGERDACRLMVLDRLNRSVSHLKFRDVEKYFKKGDRLVLNNTRVLPVRLFGKRKTGGRVELFLLEKNAPICEAMVRPSGRVKEGEEIVLESGAVVEVLSRGEIGRMVRFRSSIDDIISKDGHVPLPPYIERNDEARDKIDYQTVYSTKEGATASPTAGLHFTKDLLNMLKSSGVDISYVTLHTNYGTFAPIKTDDVRSHKMHKEYFEISGEVSSDIRKTKKSGGSVFAVGTTSTRVLEHCAEKIMNDQIPKNDLYRGNTDLFVFPGYKFQIVDHLITNFHMPRSTLLLLISAFGGREFVLDAYKQAVDANYRFFSYGDSMLIL